MRFQAPSPLELPPPVSRERRQELHLFESNAGIRFRNLEFLNLAFSHRSFANESASSVNNNEKLEFLGDSVLGLVVCEYLYLHLHKKSEGELARIKSFVVSEAALESVGKELRLESYLLVGRGEEHSGGRTRRAIVADAMEAVFGAYYLDSGFKAARKLILRLMVPEIVKVLEDRHEKDYKTLLQEYVQKQFKGYPRYSLVRKSGPDHDRTFWSTVAFAGKSFGPAKGKNKKEAEQQAAAIAFNSMKGDTKSANGRSAEPKPSR